MTNVGALPVVVPGDDDGIVTTVGATPVAVLLDGGIPDDDDEDLECDILFK